MLRQAERCGTWQHLWDKEGHKEAWHEVRVLREQRLNAREFKQGRRPHISLQASEDRTCGKNLGGAVRGHASLSGKSQNRQSSMCEAQRRHRIRVRKISRGGMTPRMPVASSRVMLSAMGSQEKAWRKGTDRIRVTREEFQSNLDAWEGCHRRQKRRARQGVLQPSGAGGHEGMNQSGRRRGGGNWKEDKEVGGHGSTEKGGEERSIGTGILHPSGGDRETTARWEQDGREAKRKGSSASRAERKFKALSTTGA